jgi:hypothetical protein
MLQTANLLFSKFLEEKRGTSTSQLLLLLSDGRGVFADGTTVSLLFATIVPRTSLLACVIVVMFILAHSK